MSKDVIYFVLKDVLNGSMLFDRMSNDIDDFFDKNETSWLTKSQVNMISDILLSANKKIIMERLNKYSSLQLKRGKKAAYAFYEMIDKLQEKYVTVIENEIKRMDLEVDLRDNNELIDITLIQKFNYLFVMKYSIKNEEVGNV